MPESGICSLSGTGKGGGNMLEQLVWSEFGDYIRDYLAGDAYGEI